MINHKRPHRKAQGLLEFALMIPVLLTVLFGAIDFGWMVFNYSSLYNGVREAVRFGSVPGIDVTPKQYIDCAGIRKMVTSLAGWSGAKAENIVVWYDDGRDVSAPITISSTLPIANAPELVGLCPSSGWDAPTTENSAYQARNAATAGARDIQNGDRVIVQVDVSVSFLTPFLRSMFPGGITMHIQSARSVFPDGLLIG